MILRKISELFKNPPVRLKHFCDPG